MRFKQLKIKVDSEKADLLGDAFFAEDALSVSVEDQFEGTEFEEPIFNEPGMEVEKLWQHSLLVVLLTEDSDIDQIVSNVQKKTKLNFDYEIENIDDQDWVRLTQSQFEPIKITDKLFIVPSWHELPVADATGIILDPGLAFGTGSHPTTFMCLEWLAKNVSATDNLLDYGCGSGILAITAAKLGAKKVTGVDIDKQAIESSLYNAEVNQTQVNFFLPDKFNPATYDIVIANILSNPLRMLASALSGYVCKGGKIVLSGILDSQIEEMSSIYQEWFDMQVYKVMDGWVCLEGIKR
ncbi:MAG: 50S ribosomal protein L11 methyltransferase [Neisseriales bacterium]|nr:MAG: 50S ribosomal protein L11 methyltransferase [Neisseriales bacterium]